MYMEVSVKGSDWGMHDPNFISTPSIRHIRVVYAVTSFLWAETQKQYFIH
jgi:hypothetical protein